MSQPATPTPEQMPDGPGVRALKIAVVAMGIMIVIGVLVVIGRIVYLASQGPRPATASGAVPTGARLAPASRLALPGGATVRQITLFGDRLAVHYEGPAGGGIAILDLASGSVLSRVDIVPEVPR
jgi:hypothetical protein